ncbi:hypothetical protein RYX36_031369 [Vicia faba]
MFSLLFRLFIFPFFLSLQFSHLFLTSHSPTITLRFPFSDYYFTFFFCSCWFLDRVQESRLTSVETSFGKEKAVD